MPLSQELVDILACPKCKGELTRIEEPDGFACASCELLYRIEDDIPNFLIDEASPYKTDEPKKQETPPAPETPPAEEAEGE
jgi:uncharacterized protein YbaR (Trm112 family)